MFPFLNAPGFHPLMKPEKELTIDEEFEGIIPPLTDEEREQLKQNLKDEGWRPNEVIVTWEGLVVDGHHRYELCRELGITDFRVVEKSFDSRAEAKLWIINNQKGRRNLTEGWKWELAQVKKKLLEDVGRDKLSEAGKRGREKQLSGGLPESGKGPEHNTQKELAKELGWSKGKVSQAEKVWDKGDDKLKEEVKAGDKSMHQAYQELTYSPS